MVFFAEFFMRRCIIRAHTDNNRSFGHNVVIHPTTKAKRLIEEDRVVFLGRWNNTLNFIVKGGKGVYDVRVEERQNTTKYLCDSRCKSTIFNKECYHVKAVKMYIELHKKELLQV